MTGGRSRTSSSAATFHLQRTNQQLRRGGGEPSRRRRRKKEVIELHSRDWERSAVLIPGRINSPTSYILRGDRLTDLAVRQRRLGTSARRIPAFSRRDRRPASPGQSMRGRGRGVGEDWHPLPPSETSISQKYVLTRPRESDPCLFFPPPDQVTGPSGRSAKRKCHVKAARS